MLAADVPAKEQGAVTGLVGGGPSRGAGHQHHLSGRWPYARHDPGARYRFVAFESSCPAAWRNRWRPTVDRCPLAIRVALGTCAGHGLIAVIGFGGSEACW